MKVNAQRCGRNRRGLRLKRPLCAHLGRRAQSPKCSEPDIRLTGINQTPHWLQHHLTLGPTKGGTRFSFNIEAKEVVVLAI